jgi:hypothetical protein
MPSDERARSKPASSIDKEAEQSDRGMQFTWLRATSFRSDCSLEAAYAKKPGRTKRDGLTGSGIEVLISIIVILPFG